jgi:hypothetical protein
MIIVVGDEKEIGAQLKQLGDYEVIQHTEFPGK